MDFKIIWSDEAIADLAGIWSYIAQHDPSAARRMASGIIDHVGILASFPFIGPRYPRGSTAGTLREIVFRSYHILYDVGEASQCRDSSYLARRPRRAAVLE
ncbi:MAG: type II toxin-antitoxin system RelE/ParE family toxin [Acidobacteriota bacterium]